MGTHHVQFVRHRHIPHAIFTAAAVKNFSFSSPDLECSCTQNPGSLVLGHVDRGGPLFHWNSFSFFYKSKKKATKKAQRMGSKGGVKENMATGNRRVKRKLVAMGLKCKKNCGKGVKETRPSQWQKVNPVAKGLNKPE